MPDHTFSQDNQPDMTQDTLLMDKTHTVLTLGCMAKKAYTNSLISREPNIVISQPEKVDIKIVINLSNKLNT